MCKAKLIVLSLFFSMVISCGPMVMTVLAGNLDAPGAPTSATSAMYTLEDIYNRLNAGTALSKRTGGFTEPSSGPTAGTGHTLDEIMAVAWPRALAPRVNKTGQTDCYYDDGRTVTCTCGTTNCPPGQDGEYQKGIDPAIAPTVGTSGAYNTPAWTGVRFTDNGDGTVTDNLTALIWLKDASCVDLPGADLYGRGCWQKAFWAANNLASGTCGLADGSAEGDWRLPNVNELHSLIDINKFDPAIPDGHHFTGVTPDLYWSSSTYTSYGHEEMAWTVSLRSGNVNPNLKGTQLIYIWPVRGGN